MRELSLSDRPIIDKYFERIPNRNFYHYFPYILAQETTVYIDEHKANPLYLDSDTLLFSSNKFEGSTLFDKNYIYKLENTIDIKNFKANIKKFDREQSFSFKPATKEDATAVIDDWYGKHSQTEDADYTIWFAMHFDTFPDIHANIGYINGKPSAFSVWGELTEDTSAHIVSKTTGTTYLQDKMRMCVYNDMIEKEFVFCNDAGDNGIHELEMYKRKLRPEFIIPIWSWEK